MWKNKKDKEEGEQEGESAVFCDQPYWVGSAAYSSSVAVICLMSVSHHNYYNNLCVGIVTITLPLLKPLRQVAEDVAVLLYMNNKD